MKDGRLPNGTAVYATILTYPFTAFGEILPTISRPNILARASEYVNPFSNTAITAADITLANPKNAVLITKFVAALLQANMLLSQPQNKDCAVKAIASQLNVSSDMASMEYMAATDPDTGETATMQGGIFNVSRQGLLNVIDIRQLAAGFAGAGPTFDFADAIVPSPSNFIDYTIRDAALDMVSKGVGEIRC